MSKTITDLHAEVTADLNDTYTLVDVSQGDSLTDKQVDDLVAGNFEALYESTEEWSSEAESDGAAWHLNEHVAGVLSRWARAGEEYPATLAEDYVCSDGWYESMVAIRERDTSTWLADLAANTPVLLRIKLIDEDASFDPCQASERDLLAKVGLPVDEENLATAANLLANVSTTIGMVYVMAGTTADVFLTLPEDGQVRVVSPYLYVGNPFSGSAMVDGPFNGSLVVDRGDLRTDNDAFGYSWNEIAGGVHASSYAAQIQAEDVAR
jgi:hypothetical protein